MGSPKKSRKQYKRPLVIWDENLIASQKTILRDYGLKNKKEIWRSEGIIKKARDQAKKLIATHTEQAEKEKIQLINRLIKLGLLKSGAKLNDILALSLNDVLERRLQTMVFKKGYAKTVKQARQFIVHGHVSINEEKMNVPSFIVPMDLENKLSFNPASRLSEDMHPERIKEKSRRERKHVTEKLDEADIFAMDKTVEAEVKKGNTKLSEEKKEKQPKEVPAKIKEKEDVKVPEEDKKREEKDKPAGKAN